VEVKSLNKLSPNEEKVCLLLGNGIMTAKQIEEASYKPMKKAQQAMIDKGVFPYGEHEQEYVTEVFIKPFPHALYGGDLRAVLIRMVRKGYLTREKIGKVRYKLNMSSKNVEAFFGKEQKEL
jgi:hypothetical protein